MRDFLEEFGGVIVASFLMIMAVSLLTGVFTAVLMILGISAVVFLVWFFWMHGRAVQVLMEIWFGKIQIKTKQKIFLRPQFFIISNADHEHNKVYKIEKENKEFKKIVYYMMELCCPVDVYCNIYQDSVTGMKLIGSGKFIRFFSCQLSEFLQLEKMQYMQQTGSIITLKTKSEPVCLFLKNSNSVLDIAFNKLFQDILQMYQKGMDLQTEELYRLYGDEIYFLDVPDTVRIQGREEKEPTSPCPNPDILDRIQQVDEKLAQGMQLKGISGLQWKNVVKPNLMEVINKKELNEKNKNEIWDILNQVEDNMEVEEKEDFETEATLSAVRTFLSINGCSKQEKKGKGKC